MACQTARVAYHEAFWVVVGTAAPVIALGSIVAFGRAISLLGGRRTQLLIGVFSMLFLTACFGFTTLVMFVSLLSLAKGRDGKDLISVSSFLLFSMLLLWVGASLPGMASWFLGLEKTKREAEPEELDPDPDLAD